jgi:hypothetical protein
MKNNSDKLEEQVERFLQAEEIEGRPKFSDASLAREILTRNKVDAPKGNLLRFVLLGMAACLLIAFLSDFQMPTDGQESAVRIGRTQGSEPLLDSDKVLLEDLMAMPAEINWEKTLPDESTFDLLVMLDTFSE